MVTHAIDTHKSGTASQSSGVERVVHLGFLLVENLSLLPLVERCAISVVARVFFVDADVDTVADLVTRVTERGFLDYSLARAAEISHQVSHKVLDGKFLLGIDHHQGGQNSCASEFSKHCATLGILFLLSIEFKN